MSKRILKQPEVLGKTKLGESSLKRMVKSGAFPAPIRLGDGRSIGWIESEIDGWIDQKAIERDAANAEAGAE
ncbi:helix-turn-helix transcriptional regulator [Methylomonas fluvii]|uniref:AlpA family phage regulatory protein n=1 Tax=Methylomonas fluvii TaxID=1854564 RepID=A0ABR9DDZ5_9GAMM|nr:AlpA family phage regulatory protein [Methylomonas fluvii]MBD9361323.1 AlpA family phage regulatory protein [Methylomonas fluvii]CAD6874250.1 hypothetical protein [Methylomonas fluvii]